MADNDGLKRSQYMNTFVRCFQDDIVVDDIIRFKEKELCAEKSAYPSKYSIEARIISESYTPARKQYFELEVIHSDGREPIEPGTIIKRRASTICRGEIARRKWRNEWNRIITLGAKQMKNVAEGCY